MDDTRPRRLKPQVHLVKLSEVRFDEEVYPRQAHDPALVQRYATCLEQIEAEHHYITLSTDRILLDGKHRYLAYRTRYEPDDPDHKIPVYILDLTDDAAQFRFACRVNSNAGWQLVHADKVSAAIRLYGYGDTYESIADTLHVSKTQVTDWLSRTVKEQKDRQDKQMMALWLACHTAEEIGEQLKLPRQTVSDRLQVLPEEYQRTHSAKLLFQDDFPVPLYNVWKQQEKSNKVTHFGNSEARWLENLLYLYTKPFDIIVDPFAGGGATIDICRHRGRRYWVSDRKPIVAREDEIRTLDLVTEGLPPLYKRWGEVSLVYLDPPYWKQSEGQYSQDPTDLANMSLDDFTATLTRLVHGFAKKLRAGARIALLMQPTQWNAPDRCYTDHVIDLTRAVKLSLAMRMQCPYESQEANAQMVDWAKEQHEVLVLSRELVIWRAPA
jgi:hypothetical protein